MKANTKHACTHDDRLLLDHIRVMSDSGSEGGGHDHGRRRLCPSRTSHLMSLRSRGQSELGDEPTRNVDSLAADRHSSSGSWVGVATQAEQPRQMVQHFDTVDDGQSGYDPSDVDLDSTIEGDIEGEVDQQMTSTLVGSRCATEERQSANLVGNFTVTEEQRSSAADAGYLLSLDHSYSATTNYGAGRTGDTMRATLTPADGSCSDEITNIQLRRAMDILRDLSDDDEQHRQRVDAFPLEASHVGSDTSYVDQSDIVVRHQRMVQRTGVTQSGEYQNGCYIDDNYWRSASRGPRSTKTTSGLSGPVMSSREVKSVSSASKTEEPSINQSINQSIRDLYNGAIIRRARRRVRGAGMSHVIS